ncbi:hypothetical protein C8J42_104134 [Sphingomonas sp. PP-CE-1A-559]|uniref:hypothetical protein n=1 Tax=Sphingomonas sp. PP-CE-1A-559 TaxID=2135657 RepID=UPI0010D6E7D8|nr:hypothetical protein [Sphingomonas sp. PP-CE-1A-559]TCP89906.1 hypothetical protein C8J42_104134 [Sphingomonas sp. PP-CE-1A-559]
MTRSRLLAAGAVRAMLLAGGVVGAVLPVAAVAQHSMAMPGMTMPDAVPKKTVKKSKSRPVAKRSGARSAAPAVPPSLSGGAVDHSTMDHSAMGHPAPVAPLTPATPSAMPEGMPGMDHAQMDHSAMLGMAMDHGAMGHAMIADPAYRAASDAALAKMPAGSAMAGMAMGTSAGFYTQGSGTSRLPAAEGPMRGYMTQAGAWMLMAHGYAWGVATDQGGPRGKSEAFVESMAMLMADRDLGDRFHIQLRTMNSLEPLMGARGYTNLFATGELANDRPLVDRQHPHDLFMELAAKVDYRLGNGASVFLYGGPVGEPALGPSAFMHRGSARYQPMSPITHHWFDSTHITYGVVTAGYATPAFQLEASAFKGREPDEHRWNIETPRLDSWSVRGTWTPSPFWAVQVSHGRLKEPEAQHPGEDENRSTASVQYARGGLATTFAYSLKDRVPGEKLSAFLAEATYELTPRHAVFGRFENVANDELFPDEGDPLHDRKFRVTKAEVGYAYRVPIVGPLGLALGGTVAAYAKSAALEAAYGKTPVNWTLFSKLAVGL